MAKALRSGHAWHVRGTGKGSVWLKWSSVIRMLFSLVAQLCLTLYDLMDCNRQAPLSMGFPRQEYWSGLPFPPLGNLPDPGIEPMSPILADKFFTTEPLGKPMLFRVYSERQGSPQRLWVRPTLTLAGTGGRCSPWVPQGARHHAKATPSASKSVLQAGTYLPHLVT